VTLIAVHSFSDGALLVQPVQQVVSAQQDSTSNADHAGQLTTRDHSGIGLRLRPGLQPDLVLDAEHAGGRPRDYFSLAPLDLRTHGAGQRHASVFSDHVNGWVDLIDGESIQDSSDVAAPPSLTCSLWFRNVPGVS